MPDSPRLQLDVSSLAERDIAEILDWTIEEFGDNAFERYDRLITQAFYDLAENPMRAGAHPLRGLPPGIFVYHLTYSRDRARTPLGVVQKPRHFIVYRVKGQILNILRLLHDAQDLPRHLPED